MAVDIAGLTITPVDPANGNDVQGYHQVHAAARATDIPDLPELSLRETVGGFLHPWPARERHHLLARLDGEPAGALMLTLPLRDNLHLLLTDLYVAPNVRRRGVGRELFQAAAQFARAHGRSLLMGDHVMTLPGGPVRDEAPAAFASAMGVSPALSEVRRRLDLDTVDKEAWPTLAADARSRATGYSVFSWVGPAPDEVIGDIARLEGRMGTDAPIGELRYEPEEYDAERMRGNERVHELRGHRFYQAAARHDASGALAAWTMLALDADVSDHAWQQTTIVDPDHRGHRLGLLVKVENPF
jgi:GNAT superfamily N-acetyltransferase